MRTGRFFPGRIRSVRTGGKRMSALRAPKRAAIAAAVFVAGFVAGFAPAAAVAVSGELKQFRAAGK